MPPPQSQLATGQLVWEFPVKGKDTNFAYRDQPPGTTQDCLNVLAYDPTTQRARGGQRPGTAKLYTSQLGSGNPIQAIGQAAFELQSQGGVVLNQSVLTGTFTGSTSQQFSYTIPGGLLSWNEELLFTIVNHAVPGGSGTMYASGLGTESWWTSITPTGTGPLTGVSAVSQAAAQSAATSALATYMGTVGGGPATGFRMVSTVTPQLVLTDSSIVPLSTGAGATVNEWSVIAATFNTAFVPDTFGGGNWTSTIVWTWQHQLPQDLVNTSLTLLANGATTAVGYTWNATTNTVTIYSPIFSGANTSIYATIPLGTPTPADVQLIAYSQLVNAAHLVSTVAPVYAPSISLFAVTTLLPQMITVNDVFTVTSGTPLNTADPSWSTRTNSGGFPQNFNGTIETSTANWTGAVTGSGVIINNTAGGVQLPNKTALWTPSLAALGNAYQLQATFMFNATAGTTDQFMLGFGIDSANLGTTGWVLVFGLDAATPTASLYTAAGVLLATANVDAFQFPQNQLITIFVTVTGTALVVQVGTKNYLMVGLVLPATSHYQVGFGYIAAAGSSLTVVNVLAQTLPGTGIRKQQVIVIANGNVYQGDGYAPGASAMIALTTGGTAKFLAGSVPQMAAADGNVYITDGFNYAVLNLATNTTAPMVADAGTLPPQCPLCCIWRGSLVFAGQIGNAQNWYISAIGDYTNFDYTMAGTSPTSAIAGNSGNAYGKIGDPIIALIPLNDDILLFGCVDQFFAFVGDPRYNGVVDHFIQDVGIFGANAWAFDPVGTLYFVGSGGLYRLAKGSTIPENLSNRVLPGFFQAIDAQTNTLNLCWDQDRFGLWIFITPTIATGTGGIHIFWDQRTGGYFPQQFPDAQGPTAALVYYGDRPDDRALLIGGRDGYVRRLLASNARNLTDDGTAISSFVDLGPNRVIDDLTEGKTLCADFYVGQDAAGYSYNFSYTLQAAPDFFNAVNAPAMTTAGGPITGQGRIPKDRNARIRGGVIMMRISNNVAGKTWNLERLVMTTTRGAPQR